VVGLGHPDHLATRARRPASGSSVREEALARRRRGYHQEQAGPREADAGTGEDRPAGFRRPDGPDPHHAAWGSARAASSVLLPCWSLHSPGRMREIARAQECPRASSSCSALESGPTRYRNHNGYLLRWDGEGLLFDRARHAAQMIFGRRHRDGGDAHPDHPLPRRPLPWPRRHVAAHLARSRAAPGPRVLSGLGARLLHRLRRASIYHDVATQVPHAIEAPGRDPRGQGPRG